MEDHFKIRSYSYGELALLYFPKSAKKSASVQLARWVKQNEFLKKQLRDSGFKPGRRILTPKQVRLMITHFGEP